MFILSVKLTSPRMLSCRVLTGWSGVEIQLAPVRRPVGSSALLGSGKDVHQREPRGAQTALRDDVAGEDSCRSSGSRRARRGRCRSAAGARGERAAEVARALGRRRHERAQRAGAAPLAPPLLRPEEEGAVLDDGAVEVAAEVVVAQRRPLDARLVGEPVVGVRACRCGRTRRASRGTRCRRPW